MDSRFTRSIDLLLFDTGDYNGDGVVDFLFFHAGCDSSFLLLDGKSHQAVTSPFRPAGVWIDVRGDSWLRNPLEREASKQIRTRLTREIEIHDRRRGYRRLKFIHKLPPRVVEVK